MTEHPPCEHPPCEHPPCEHPPCADCAQARCTAGFRGVATAELRDVVSRALRVHGFGEHPQYHAWTDAGADLLGRLFATEIKEASVLTCPQCGHQFTPAVAPTRVTEAVQVTDIEVSARDARNSMTEAMINGARSFDDIRELVRSAVRAMLVAAGVGDSYDGYCWAYIVDISDTDVVYMVNNDDLYQCPYTLSGEVVTLGVPFEVVRTYMPAPAEQEPAGEDALESRRPPRRVEIGGTARVLEAKGTDASGNRIFRVRIIAYGDSKNNRRYPESVLRAAAPLYEGAKAFDHHRSAEEMASGTIQGLVGYYRDVTAESAGIEADLVLLPSAVQAAEALDAALALEGTDPLVGISHDAYAMFRPIQEAGKQMQEATEITSVNSADIVAHPAAGGQATRVVAGGVDTEPEGSVPAGESTKETDVAVNAADVLAALKEATDDQLAEVGFARTGTTETAPTGAPAEPDKVTEAGTELMAKHTFLARRMIADLVAEAELPKEFAKAITEALPEQVSEAMIVSQIAAQKSVLAVAERAGLTPTRRYGEGVTKEARDKKIQALDYFFVSRATHPDYGKGYRSFKEAFIDITGKQPSYMGADFNRLILRESFGSNEGGWGYDSDGRTVESMDSGTWNLVLGDSITRRLVAEYDQPDLMNWKQIVSSMPPINDFRQQRIDRIGGYGVLPIVNQGQPYQPLTSPTNQEIQYVIAKRGGTEDITWEMIVNDDVRSIQKIPTKLGLAAAQTLYRFVWDIFVTNAATSYDSTALFHATHGNTAAAALSQTNLSAGRKAMRKQTAYGDSQNVLSIVPKFLIVCSDLEELAFQLCTSAVAIPATPAGPTDTPNIHQGLTPITVDYWSSTTEWHLATAPGLIPTIEVGFFQGRQVPELFTQADNTVGSMFNADKITYKIRHVYGSAVLDHVGLYRGNS